MLQKLLRSAILLMASLAIMTQTSIAQPTLHDLLPDYENLGTAWWATNSIKGNGGTDITNWSSNYNSPPYYCGWMSWYYDYKDITLPFDFPFDGVVYTKARVYTMGSVNFMLSTEVNPQYSTSSAYYLYRSPAIEAFSTYAAVHQVTQCGGYQTDHQPGAILMKVIGNAPNRICIFEFNNLLYYYVAYYRPQWSTQIRIHEGSGVFEIIKGPFEGHQTYYNYEGGAIMTAGAKGRYTSYAPWDGRFINFRSTGLNAYNWYTSVTYPYPTYSNYPYQYGQFYTYTYTYAPYNNYFNTMNTRLRMSLPSITGAHPGNNQIVLRGAVLDHTSKYPAAFAPHPYADAFKLTAHNSGGRTLEFQMSITGPIIGGTEPTIYQARDTDNDTWVQIPTNVGDAQQGQATRYYIPKATGPNAGATTNPSSTVINPGALDLRLGTNITPGDYRVVMNQKYNNVVKPMADQFFTVALDKDIAVSNVISPRDRTRTKYPLPSLGNGFPGVQMIMEIRNKGVTPVEDCEVKYEIFNSSGTKVAESNWIYYDFATTLNTGDRTTYNFGYYVPTDIGIYSVKYYVNWYPNKEEDEDLGSNIYPSGNNVFEFEIAHEVELAVNTSGGELAIPSPSGNVYMNRPVPVIGHYFNNGVNDVDRANAHVVIKDPDGAIVYDEEMEVRDIEAYNPTPGSSNSGSQVPFPTFFTPLKKGQYSITLTIESDDDPIQSNNSASGSFTVVEGMSGDWTISATGSGSRNFVSFDAAMDALYQRGITGPIRFLLPDREYIIGSTAVPSPALDMSGKIAGVSSTNTITFAPSTTRSVERAADNSGVTLKLRSGAGIGVLIGQNLFPSNINAIVNNSDLPPALRKEYAKSSGNIIFDGGVNKSIRFQLHVAANMPLQVAAMLRNGVENAQFNNIIFDNKSLSTIQCGLPIYQYNASIGGFLYEQDLRNGGLTGYSAAIVSRAVVPVDASGTNQIGLDTLTNNNNKFQGNEISGFGYGIVSLGTGVIWYTGLITSPFSGEPVSGTYLRYYNKNNVISNNIIRDVTTAGVVIGFEEDAMIKGNRIFNVNGNCSVNGQTAGIWAGGFGRTNWYGYNNLRPVIDGNEIHHVYAPKVNNSMVVGVRIEQSYNGYLDPSQGTVFFPEVSEKSIVRNNIVRDINVYKEDATAVSANRGGIHLYSSRGASLLTPQVKDYMMRGDLVANNTVVINDDGGLNNTGAVVGIGVQNARDVRVYNNAVAMLDQFSSVNAPVRAAIFYQGWMPGTGGAMMSDRNAFYIANEGSNGPDVYHLIESDKDGNILDYGGVGAYKTMRQWRNWSHQDMNSVQGNFVAEHELIGNEPDQKLRIMTNLTPKGSILNNRGFILMDVSNQNNSLVRYDLDGQMRGEAGRMFDIGADEFDGRLHVKDVEMVGITYPSAYKSIQSPFNEAEHIMTDEWQEVRALFRNSGNLHLTGVEITMEIYMENGSGVYPSSPTTIMKKNIDVLQSGATEVVFKLYEDGQPAYAKTYSELTGYAVPTRFLTMTSNVTPRYRIRIYAESDQNNVNNEAWADYRFYLKQSKVLNMLISADKSYINANQSVIADDVAGSLNFNTLVDGIEGIGWLPMIHRDNMDTKAYKVDIFDRASWEPKAIDYSNYVTMFWSDAGDKALGRYQRIAMENYLESGDAMLKKNIIIGSQDIVRELTNNGAAPLSVNDPNYPILINPDFANGILRSVSNTPHNPRGSNQSYHGYNVMGVYVGRDLVEMIQRTGNVNDVDPMPALLSVYPEGDGLARQAYKYLSPNNAGNLNGMGIATVAFSRNVVLLGVDWRHFADVERVLRASIDFIEKNGGTVIPIELSEFNAVARGSQVDIFWTTQTEIESDKFEVERATISTTGIRSQFEEIAEVKAAGSSDSPLRYALSDKNVSYGNSYIYRLKMIDITGSYEYSEERMVEIGGSAGLWLEEAMPNPALSGQVSFKFGGDMSTVQIQVVDAQGRTVNADYTLSSDKLEVNVSELSSGQYTLVLRSGTTTVTKQFQVVK